MAFPLKGPQVVLFLLLLLVCYRAFMLYFVVTVVVIDMYYLLTFHTDAHLILNFSYLFIFMIAI